MSSIEEARDKDMSDMETMMKDLLKNEDHLDVTFILEDGELKSNKFILSARSSYFSGMFNKSSNFSEASGIVKFPCKKYLMEKVIQYLYGGGFDCVKMSVEDKVELFNVFKMILLQDSMGNLEFKLFYPPIQEHEKSDDSDDDGDDEDFSTAEALVYATDILNVTLKLDLEISKSIIDYMATRLGQIVQILKKEKVDLPANVVKTLVDKSKCSEIDKFRFVNMYWKTIFDEENLPEIKLEDISVEELENEVASSGVFEEKLVLKTIIKVQKEEKKYRRRCYYSEVDSDDY